MTRPWRIVERFDTAEGTLELRQRGGRDFLITIDGRILMNAAGNLSEIVLGRLACEPLPERPAPRVLVGGLGMGFTLRAALDALPAEAVVVTVELNPAVVDWCRGPLAPLTGGAVDDPRVAVVIGDVAASIREAAGRGEEDRFDAVVLDLYEGPHDGDGGRNDHVWGRAALARTRAALRPGGILAAWSEDPCPSFERRLRSTGFTVRRHRPGRGSRHTVYICRRG